MFLPAVGSFIARRSLLAPLGRSSPMLAAVAVCIGASGCVTRTVDTSLVKLNTLQVSLRHQEKGGVPVDRGYAHPALVSVERLRHILAAVDVMTRDGAVEEHQIAIPDSLLDDVATELSTALAEANPSQEIVVMAIERRRRFGVFTHKYLTSFVAFARGDELYLDFSRVGWEIPKKREDRLPAPYQGDAYMDFRVVAARAMRAAGPQTLAVDWRDPLFREPIQARRGSGGEVQRRTVIMDMDTDRAAPDSARRRDPLPPDLPPDVLRELADLEDARAEGRVTESEYQHERQRILEGGDRP